MTAPTIFAVELCSLIETLPGELWILVGGDEVNGNSLKDPINH